MIGPAAPDAPFWRTLGRRIAAARVAAGMTQDVCAERTGLGRSSIANLEGGRQRVPVYELIRLRSVVPFTVPGLPADEESDTVRALNERVAELTRANNSLRGRLRKIRCAMGPVGPDERERDG